MFVFQCWIVPRIDVKINNFDCLRFNLVFTIFFKILLITMRKNTKNAAIPCNNDIIACLIVTAIIKIYFITIPKDHSFFDIKSFLVPFVFHEYSFFWVDTYSWSVIILSPSLYCTFVLGVSLFSSSFLTIFCYANAGNVRLPNSYYALWAAKMLNVGFSD